MILLTHYLSAMEKYPVIISEIEVLTEKIKELGNQKKITEERIKNYMIINEIDLIQLKGGSISKKYVQKSNSITKDILKIHLDLDLIETIYKSRKFEIREKLKYVKF